ncbi:MAG: hypothetical protein LEGION0398_MBIBDBAK_00181 [Legionellaceae bacterium]
MTTRLQKFKKKIKHAVDTYVEKKAGSLDTLKEKRAKPCRAIYEAVNTLEDWKALKKTITAELDALETGWFGRSKLRRLVNEVMSHPRFSDQQFYESDIKYLYAANKRLADKNTTLKQENQKLTFENQSVSNGSIASQVRSRFSMLVQQLKTKEVEVKALLERKTQLEKEIKELEAAKHALNQQNEEPESPESQTSDDVLSSYNSFLDSGSQHSLKTLSFLSGKANTPKMSHLKTYFPKREEVIDIEEVNQTETDIESAHTEFSDDGNATFGSINNSGF